MRPKTISTLDIWKAPTIEESKKLLEELKVEIAKIKAWHAWDEAAEHWKSKIANGEGKTDPELYDRLRRAENRRDEWAAEYR